MKILAAADSIFRLAVEHEPWFPVPTPGQYSTDEDWQRAHLWDHVTESDNTHGPYRGPSILHHPDLPYAIDNGWRVYGGDKDIDHQTRGESGSGTRYLYKVGPNGGLIHSVHLDTGPDEAYSWLDDNDEAGLGLPYGTVPDKNYRHLVTGDGGGYFEGPESHETLRDLVDDEQERSSRPGGYKDFAAMPGYSGERSQRDLDLDKKNQHATRRAWETGTNESSHHYDEAPVDSASIVDQMPRNRRPVMPEEDGPGEEEPRSKHPRYGGL